MSRDWKKSFSAGLKGADMTSSVLSVEEKRVRKQEKRIRRGQQPGFLKREGTRTGKQRAANDAFMSRLLRREQMTDNERERAIRRLPKRGKVEVVSSVLGHDGQPISYERGQSRVKTGKAESAPSRLPILGAKKVAQVARKLRLRDALGKN